MIYQAPTKDRSLKRTGTYEDDLFALWAFKSFRDREKEAGRSSKASCPYRETGALVSRPVGGGYVNQL